MKTWSSFTRVPALVASLAVVPIAAEAQSLLADPAAELSTRDISPTDQARDTMNLYAECIVKTGVNRVRRALSQPDELINASLARIASSDCLLDGELRMDASLFRGAVFRALYMRDFGREPLTELGDVAMAVPTEPLLAFADCVIQLEPAHTRSFVLAKPATVGEREAIANLSATLGRCVAPGDQVGFSKAVLQGALAEALYKRTAAAAASPLADAN